MQMTSLWQDIRRHRVEDEAHPDFPAAGNRDIFPLIKGRLAFFCRGIESVSNLLVFNPFKGLEAEKLLANSPQKNRRLGVAVDDHAVGVEMQYPKGRTLENGTKLSFACLDLFLGALALGDVRGKCNEGIDVSLLVLQGYRCGQVGVRFSIRMR